ncbi:MAG: hypothetical protein JST82_07735 [Bacteroidetes bacterium]|nr:hypothetical protein [Bacteroidota bacterium]
MKHSIQLLVVIGMIHFSAAAQTTPYSTEGLNYATVNDKNYKVCHIDEEYKVCDASEPLTVNTKPVIDENEVKIEKLRELDTFVNMAPKKAEKKPVDAIDGNDPYKGKDSKTNDGVGKNIQRNLNYNTGVDVPASDGGLTNKK